MTNLKLLIEAILFAAGKPLTVKKISTITDSDETAVRDVVQTLTQEYTERESGIRIIESTEGVQMGTAPDAAATIALMTKDETTGELTKAQLETLSIIAYRGPITKGTLEEIRGVNCGMILRNLLIRGLIVEAIDPAHPNEKRYGVSHDFMGFLGIANVQDLPDYASLSTHEALEAFLKSKTMPPTSEPPSQAA